VLMILQTGFVLGLGMLLSAANAYFRDVQHFLGIFLNVWFYCTPILFDPDKIDAFDHEVMGVKWRTLLQFNPMTQFVDAYRNVLYDLRWPTATNWVALVLISGVTLAIGAAGFRRLEPHLAEEL
jgi:ABC-2 type transport system permease protein